MGYTRDFCTSRWSIMCSSWCDAFAIIADVFSQSFAGVVPPPALCASCRSTIDGDVDVVKLTQGTQGRSLVLRPQLGAVFAIPGVNKAGIGIEMHRKAEARPGAKLFVETFSYYLHFEIWESIGGSLDTTECPFSTKTKRPSEVQGGRKSPLQSAPCFAFSTRSEAPQCGRHRGRVSLYSIRWMCWCGSSMERMEIFFVGFFDWVQKSYIIGEAYPRSQRLNYWHLLTFNWVLLQFRVRYALFQKMRPCEVGYWGLYLEPRMLMSELLGESWDRSADCRFMTAGWKLIYIYNIIYTI